MMGDDLFEHVRSYIDQHRLFHEVSTIILGYSGGADSTALLHLLVSYTQHQPMRLVVAHVNYGLRGAESDRDEDFVRCQCQLYQLPFFLKKVSRDQLLTRADSIQMCCRTIRFEFFRHLCQQEHAERIALGHTLDDNVELFFIRLVSGAGLEGLKAMLPLTADHIARPLLNSTRRQIEDYLRENGFAYVEDSSNQGDAYIRNKVRHHIVPLIEQQLRCCLNEILTTTLAILRGENDLIEELVRLASSDPDLVRREHQRICLDLTRLMRLHPALRRRLIVQVLYELFQPDQRPGKLFQKVEAIMTALEAGSEIRPRPISGMIMIRTRSLCLECYRQCREAYPSLSDQYLAVPGSIKLTPTNQCLDATVLESPPDSTVLEDIFHDPSVEIFDAALIAPRLFVRARCSGDRFIPFGMSRDISLKKYLINQRIPVQLKGLVPLVISDDRIIWIAGRRRSNYAPVTSRTRQCLLLRLIQSTPNGDTP
ncbi:tRNA lysidine(34) synthetase TilS [bacterium]|nr:tRNA lysidine(34) synthetase TilS [bacterium]